MKDLNEDFVKDMPGEKEQSPIITSVGKESPYDPLRGGDENPEVIERDPEMKISEHITYREATESFTAERLDVKNEPTDEQLEVMKVTAKKVFEPVRRFWKVPIWITSFFRTAEVNAGIPGSKGSQHMDGEAIDMDAQVYGHISNRQIFEYIRDNCIFDQLIWEEGTDEEPAWVHVSYRAGNNGMEVLRKTRKKGKVKYVRL